jgi:hypothetical protein
LNVFDLWLVPFRRKVALIPLTLIFLPAFIPEKKSEVPSFCPDSGRYSPLDMHIKKSRSAEGALNTSLGQRPRKYGYKNFGGLKSRSISLLGGLSALFISNS